MKQYIKPQTEETALKIDALMQTISGGEEYTSGNHEAATKSRDVWSDGYWN
jgi:hypothetical protein